MALLNPGDSFPALDLHRVGGETVDVSEHLHGRFGIVLFNRGAWCPFCNAQLRGFERVLGQLEELGAAVVSLSVDDEATTRQMAEKHKITFPVGHSADAAQLADLTGAFVNPDPSFVQATGFILDPEGAVILGAYSSGAIGRITAEDTVGMIRYIKSSHA